MANRMHLPSLTLLPKMCLLSCSSLKLDRACIVGLSMGGTEAIDVVAAHPQVASCLIVVAGSPA
jgi:homoserine acetyltransferase